jgi:hypothetical protein
VIEQLDGLMKLIRLKRSIHRLCGLVQTRNDPAVGEIVLSPAFRRLFAGGRLKQGDVVIFVAFGAGLTWANAVVTM